MEQAFDTFQNQLVFARDCERGNFFRERYVRERYVCPCCEDDVFLAAGEIQSPHFKHHQGAPDCEKRVAGMAQGYFSDIETESRDVNVLARFSHKRGEVTCDFALRYRPSYQVESIRVTMGAHDRSYQLHGRQEVEIPLSNSSEHIILVGLVSGQTIVRRIIKAFGKTPALFRFGSKTSVKLPEKRVIRPGRYVACFPSDVNIQFPLACKAQDITCALGLRGVSFIVPTDFNHRIAIFCRETFGMEVQIRNFSCSVIMPLALSEAAPDCWTTSTEGEAQIVLGSRIRDRYPIQVIVQYRDRVQLVTEIRQIAFGGFPQVLKVKIRTVRPLDRVGMGNPVQFLTELRFLETFPEPETTRFRFAFRNLASGVAIEVCRSSSKLTELLMGVRAREYVVISIAHPAAVKLSATDSRSRTALAPETQADELTKLLRDSTEPLWIEATGYRSILVPPLVPSPPPPRPVGRFVPEQPLVSRRRQAQAFRLGCCSSYSAYISKQ